VSVSDRLQAIGDAARLAAETLRTVSANQRGDAIRAMAHQLRERSAEILKANAKDVASATTMIDRLVLNEERLELMARAVEQIADLPDPVGQVMDRWTRPNGLEISRIRTPIGVIGMIYESRPNVTADAAAICLRSANTVILRSGSEALRSAVAIGNVITGVLQETGLPAASVQVVPTADREAVGLMLQGLSGNMDLIIPRGGRALVERVAIDARVPVLGHLEGVCHTYVHESADHAMAANIVRNAKLRRVSVCGATETLLIDRKVAPAILPTIVAALDGCELRGDDQAQAIIPMGAATEADWRTEYLAPVLAVKIVASINDAIDHIGKFGTGHTEAIIAQDKSAAEIFLNRVDSSIVLWNASTQFADGGEFGFGAEIGIATGKIHARGPVGPEQLTTFKYQVRGNGQIRP
jgi:glutamate-5-semialdehyde dehydrogenase